MSDPAHQATDAIIAKIEKDITKEYKKAHKEVTQKLDDYLARFATKDKKWQEWVANGTKTAQEYKDWKMGQILVGQRWADLKDSLAKDYGNAAKISQSIANGYRPEVYALNHNYSTFEIEKKSKLNTSYTLYSRESVERMYRENPRLYHKPGQTISQQIKEGKLARWDKRRIQSVLMQGILQGESIPNLTQRLEKVTGGDHKAAIRNIRTMMTGVENAGRVDAQDRAKSMGIPVVKQWIATLDSRTRHWHRELDGVTAETDEPFENEFGKIMFPGDPDADPANIYNCRCTLLSSIKGHELDIKDERVSYADEYADMTYDEWKAAKKSYSNPIDLPEKKAAAFKQTYINEYAGGHGGQGGQHAHTAAEGQKIMDQWHQEQAAAQAAPAHVIAEGKDISETWERRPDKFDFEIEDVINAQGFDGKPRVVTPAEFDEAVKKANGGKGFIAQRTYSAPNQEVLDAYRDQLYNGKWYVDCSTGGAQYGQGMYCAANYSGDLSVGIKMEMKHYKDLGESRYETYFDAGAARQRKFEMAEKAGDSIIAKGGTNTEARKTYDAIMNMQDREWAEKYAPELLPTKGVSYTETITLDPSAKVISWRDLQDLRTGSLNISYREKLIDEEIKKMKLSGDEATFIKYNLGRNVTWNEVDKAARNLGDDGRQSAMQIVEGIGEKVTSAFNKEQKRRNEMAHIYQQKYKDPGSMAAGLGYDAINAENHGESGSYTVIVNRTKVIIKGGS